MRCNLCGRNWPYVEAKQRALAERLGIQPRTLEEWLADPALREAIARVGETDGDLERTRRYIKRIGMPAKYQNPYTYAVLVQLADRVERAYRKIKAPISLSPCLATLPFRSARPNALSWDPAKTGQAVVLFEEELLLLYFHFAKILSYLVPIEDLGGGISALDPTVEGVKGQLASLGGLGDWHSRLVTTYVTKASIQSVEMPPPPADEFRQTMLMLALDGAEIFVMAHEYGHIVNGHLNDEVAINEFAFGSTQQSIEANSRSHEAEFAADRSALLAYIAYWQEKFSVVPGLLEQSVPMLLWPIEMCFFIETHLGRAYEVLGGEPAGGGSHPPATERLNRIRTTLAEVRPDWAAQGASMVESVFTVLWENVQPELAAAKTSGVRPFPSWALT